MSAIKTFLLLLALFSALHLSPLCEAAVCYVKPTEPHNATCPGKPCYTLDEYMSNSTLSRYFTANTVFDFLNGHHNLSHYGLNVSNVHNLTLRPYIKGGSNSVVIYSDFPKSPLFYEVSDVVITGMTCENISFTFDSCINVTLTELRLFGVHTNISLTNVFGLVNLSKLILESESESENNLDGILLEWKSIASQFPLIPFTKVLLHELLINISRSTTGISISDYVPNEIIIVLTDSNIVNQWYGVYLYSSEGNNNLSFVCKNTLFHNNINALFSTSQFYHIALYNVSYIDNNLAMWFFNARNATIKDCYFKGSQPGGAITAIDSVLSLVGNVTFLDNHNYGDGGAISLAGNSVISIPKPNSTYILFENNTSNSMGGAIYFNGFYTGTCKIDLPEPVPKTKVFNFTLNKAADGGNAIYGPNLEDDCATLSGVYYNNLSRLILNVSSFTPSFDKDHSVISSDPESLWFCDIDRDCFFNKDIPSLSVYPGQVYELSVALLGDMGGYVRYPLYATVDSGELGNPLQQLQYTNATSCKNLSYSIFGNRKLTTMNFHIGTSKPCTILMTLLDCPLGFVLSVKQECVCNKKLLSIGNVTCNITEQTIHRQGTTWIGALEQNISNISVVFSTTCPFNYCYRSNKKINSSNCSLDEDIQCTGNRAGVLCGGCMDNFSLALGSNRCLCGCSTSKLSLIIAFAAAGIALVFFIKILNLTVSQGTLNGLIFYANIVGLEFFPSVASNRLAAFLSVFIAWLNLDLGIETCFFTGMDAYAKAWLQFVFPVYVWIIALFIIILSHYSVRASQLFGNNSVPVLATLILLSYSKLLRAAISALSFTTIHFLNGSTLLVWMRDGNIQYFTEKHIPLFVFAVAVLVLLWFPLTLILVSIQWLQKGTHYRVLCWVAKLKPFFDAFTGPLKDKHRYWVGTLLLARCILLLVFFLYTANGERVALLSINISVTIIIVFLATTGSVYRNFFLTILELSYFLNLMVLVAGTSFLLSSFNKESNQTLVTVCVGIAFLQFVATVIYHAGVQLKAPLNKLQLKELLKKIRARIRVNYVVGNEEDINGPQRNEYEPIKESPSIEQPLGEPTFQEVSNFREPLLAYLND